MTLAFHNTLFGCTLFQIAAVHSRCSVTERSYQSPLILDDDVVHDEVALLRGKKVVSIFVLLLSRRRININLIVKLVYLVGQYTCKLFNIATQTHHFDEFLVQLEEWEPKPSAKYCQSPLLKTRFEDFLE